MDKSWSTRRNSCSSVLLLPFVIDNRTFMIGNVRHTITSQVKLIPDSFLCHISFGFHQAPLGKQHRTNSENLSAISSLQTFASRNPIFIIVIVRQTITPENKLFQNLFLTHCLTLWSILLFATKQDLKVIISSQEVVL
jgi:hypothetical protein